MTADNYELAKDFYIQNYAFLSRHILKRGPKIFLGEAQNRRCRFCDRREPEVTFRKIAHAVPASLGNRTLFVLHECDRCNDLFGRTIENDLGNWSKPARLIGRIPGRKGIPKIKDNNGEWRIAGDTTGLSVSHNSINDVFEVDEENQEITISLTRDPYTPIAVLKALIRIGITLLPKEEIGPFGSTLKWIRTSHDTHDSLAHLPVVHTFLPGARAGTMLNTLVLRRENHRFDLPYAFLILMYGNEMLQVSLPAPDMDTHLYSKPLEIPPFPNLTKSDVGVRQIHLTDTEVVVGDKVTFKMSYGARVETMASGSPIRS